MKKGIIYFLRFYVKYYPLFLSLFLMIGVYISNNKLLQKSNLLPIDYQISDFFIIMYIFIFSMILYIVSDIIIAITKDKDKNEK